MEADKDKIKGVHIFLSGTREELDKIETAFQWIKMNLKLKKTELYKKAFLLIASNEKVREKFIEFLLAEKAKTQIMEIKE
jgi:hypothetical protein